MKINDALIELAVNVQILVQQNNQFIGENRDFYITIEQLHNIIKEMQDKINQEYQESGGRIIN